MALWQPYDYIQEKAEIARKLVAWRTLMEQNRAAINDPVSLVVHLKCAACAGQGTKKLSGQLKISRSDWELIKASDPRNVPKLLNIVSQHGHFLPMLDLVNVGALLLGRQNNFVICMACGEHPPFNYTVKEQWQHGCRGNIWFLPDDGSGPPALKWVGPKRCWSLKLRFHNAIYRNFDSQDPAYLAFDKVAKCWMISDTIAESIFNLIHSYFPNAQWDKEAKKKFDERQKKFANMGGGPAPSARALACQEVFDSLPPAFLQKFFRMACIELHPDKFEPNMRAHMNEQFLKFKLAWEKAVKNG